MEHLNFLALKKALSFCSSFEDQTAAGVCGGFSIIWPLLSEIPRKQFPDSFTTKMNYVQGKETFFKWQQKIWSFLVEETTFKKVENHEMWKQRVYKDSTEGEEDLV